MGESALPELWPGWETVRVIGHGSFGAVYEIRREVFGDTEKAALKVMSIPQSESEISDLRKEGYRDEDITEVFSEHLRNIVNEYKLMRKLNGNTNIVSCDDMRTIQHDDGMGWDIYIKMELLTPVDDLDIRSMNETEIIKLGMDMCRALMLCEQENIIHRDIKPANIFISDKGSYKLGDFGIAKTMEQVSGGTKTGTYEYMAPEVYNNQPYGTQADIYSLGVVMYRMMNGKRGPFIAPGTKVPSQSEKEAARARRFAGKKLPPPAHGSKELKSIVLKACEFKPSARYKTARDMYEALSDLHNTGGKGKKRGFGKLSGWRKKPVPPTRQGPVPDDETVVEQGGGQTSGGKNHIEFKKILPFIAGGCVLLAVLIALFVRPYSRPVFPPDTPSAPAHAPASAEKAAGGNRMAYFGDETGENAALWGNTNHDRSEVTAVTFKDTLAGTPKNAWDISENGDGSILAWLEGTHLYAAADGPVSSDNMYSFFRGFSQVTDIDFGGCFDTSEAIDMSSMFSGCESLTTLDVSGFDTSKVMDMSSMFTNCTGLTTLDVSGFDTSNVTDMSGMFGFCESLESLNVSGFDTSKATNMSCMFYGCISLSALDVSGFDTARVLDMTAMFYDCSRLTALDVSGFDTSKVTDMIGMFYDCNQMTALDVSGFDTSRVKNMTTMFSECWSLTALDVSGFDTSRAIDMTAMFHNCNLLKELDVNGFNTSNVTNMSFMFYGCSALTALDVSGFDTAKVTNMKGMFYNCSYLLAPDVSGWDVSRVTEWEGFMNPGLGIGNEPWEEFFAA